MKAGAVQVHASSMATASRQFRVLLSVRASPLLFAVRKDLETWVRGRGQKLQQKQEDEQTHHKLNIVLQIRKEKCVRSFVTCI